MTKYYVIYKRTNGFLDCLALYANNIGDAFKRAKEVFKDHNYPVEEILGISKRNIV